MGIDMEGAIVKSSKGGTNTNVDRGFTGGKTNVDRDVAIFVARTRVPRSLGMGVEEERSEFRKFWKKNKIWPDQSKLEEWLSKQLKLEAVLATLHFIDPSFEEGTKEEGDQEGSTTCETDIDTFTALLTADNTNSSDAMMAAMMAQFRSLYSGELMADLWNAGSEIEYDNEKAKVRKLGHVLYNQNIVLHTSSTAQQAPSSTAHQAPSSTAPTPPTCGPQNWTKAHGQRVLALHHMLLKNAHKILVDTSGSTAIGAAIGSTADTIGSTADPERVCRQYADGVDCIWFGIGDWQISSE